MTAIEFVIIAGKVVWHKPVTDNCSMWHKGSMIIMGHLEAGTAICGFCRDFVK
jgi:hypothetical protein